MSTDTPIPTQEKNGRGSVSIANMAAMSAMDLLPLELFIHIAERSGVQTMTCVCKGWHDALCGDVSVLASLMVVVRGSPQAALEAAVKAGKDGVARHLLQLPRSPARADGGGRGSQVGCPASRGGGRELVWAARNGHVSTARLLLGWPIHPARADCENGYALVAAAAGGNVGMVRLLLEWPTHAPRADCQMGEAVVWAARKGDAVMVRLLLDWPTHAPRVNCRMVEYAAEKGHVSIVRLLLLEHPNVGAARRQAVKYGLADVVAILDARMMV